MKIKIPSLMQKVIVTWFDRSHKTSSATVTAQMSKDIFSGAVSMVATACNVPP